MSGIVNNCSGFNEVIVSIIIPCYNSGAYLEATVRSVMEQTHGCWECVLVDDGSTDSTPAVIKSMCILDDRIRAVHQENGGRAKACNLGFKSISNAGQYLFFLDSDDLLASNALESMVHYLNQNDDVGLLACQFDEIDESGEFIKKGLRSRWVPGWFLPRPLGEKEYETPFVSFFCATGQGPFALFRRTIFERTMGYDESLSHFSAHEDTDIFCQMALEAPVHCLPDRLYQKRTHIGQVTSVAWRIQGAYEVFRRKWDNMKGRNPLEKNLLINAKRYYERRHKPFRALKVALRALGEWCKSPSRDSSNWILHCISTAVGGFFGKKP